MSLPDPSLSPNGVWIPLPLAHALFACYYGEGPTFRGPRLSPPEDPPSPPSEETRIKLGNTMREWIPRGYAALQDRVQSPEGPPPSVTEPES
jgi:hypothetical protein